MRYQQRTQIFFISQRSLFFIVNRYVLRFGDSHIFTHKLLIDRRFPPKSRSMSWLTFHHSINYSMSCSISLMSEKLFSLDVEQQNWEYFIHATADSNAYLPAKLITPCSHDDETHSLVTRSLKPYAATVFLDLNEAIKLLSRNWTIANGASLPDLIVIISRDF